MTKKIKKSAILAVIMAIMIYATAVMAYAQTITYPILCPCNTIGSITVTKTTTSSSATVSLPRHTGAYIILTLYIEYVGTNGAIYTLAIPGFSYMTNTSIISTASETITGYIRKVEAEAYFCL